MRGFLAAIIVLLATGAQAHSTVSPRDNWSALSSTALQRYPPAVREALRAAQKSCGGDEIRVRPGLVRYLKGPAGEEFVAVHFDKFYCLNDATLCSSEGCLHRVFGARTARRSQCTRSGGASVIIRRCVRTPFLQEALTIAKFEPGVYEVVRTFVSVGEEF